MVTVPPRTVADPLCAVWNGAGFAADQYVRFAILSPEIEAFLGEVTRGIDTRDSDS